MPPRDILADNLDHVEERLRSACARAGRDRSAVTLVAVTKTVSANIAALLPELGVVDLGESRPQELWRKSALLPAGVRWHLIGHLQRNKIERTVPLIHRLHSIDSERLLAALEEFDSPRPIESFIEVNCSGESSKNGFAPDDVPRLVPVLRSLRRVRIVGLMTMAAHEDDAQRCRPAFARLRQLLIEMRGRVGDVHPLSELSMGMSNDFEVAVEEGATVVRLGTVLFAGLGGEEGQP
jgi:pyridoxal phosphate enzyme (YggS family)